MQKLTISDFSGGIQESLSPDDFTQRQWAQLKGVVPVNQTTFKSQWPAQRLGLEADGNVDFNAVFPLESSLGTFLIGIKTDGHIYWAKVPAASETSIVVEDTIDWLRLTDSLAINYGIPSSRNITIKPNPDYRFITGLDFEAYKYTKKPLAGRESDFTQDIIATIDEEAEGTIDSASLPAVLIGCRRHNRYDEVAQTSRFYMWDKDDNFIHPWDQQILAVYIDVKGTRAVGRIPGQYEQGVVRAVVFPHMRRWPTYTRNYSSTNPDGTPIANWPQITVDGVVYGIEERAYPMIPYEADTTVPGGQDKTFMPQYPMVNAGTYANSPKAIHLFHPYTYLDRNSALLPGRGIIPRGNVGAIWNNGLILGDVEWRSESAFEATNTNKKVKPSGNRAAIGLPALSDNNTEEHRGHIYFSREDIDIFDPRNVESISGSDARIAGMHVLDNYLVCITTFNGPNDGVVALSGNATAKVSYTGSPNLFAVRRQLIRGGVGVADYPDTGNGHTTQTCLWSEPGNVVFIDKFGGIYATDGRSCDRIDRYGPKQPTLSTYHDHVAAVEKHLFAWRNQRLIVLTLVESNGQQASGCWTELVLPETVTGAEGVKSMIGGAGQMFMVVNGHVWRYCINGPAAEYGYINGSHTNDPDNEDEQKVEPKKKIDIVVSTATLGDTNAHKKTNWFRFGFSFYTETECWLKEAYVRGEAMLLSGVTVPEYTFTNAGEGKHFEDGHHEVVYPAAIGSQTVMSARFTFTGNVILKGATVWGTGGVMERGEK